MIKGDINNVINWLDLNGIEQWTVYCGAGKNGQGKIFESNFEMPRDSEIERFKKVMLYSENAVMTVHGKNNPKQQTGIFIETWSNAAPSAISIGAAPAFDADYIDSKIKAAVAEERLIWREKELAKRESAVAEAEREYKRNSEGVWGVILEKAGPLLAQIMPRAAVAGVPGTPTPVAPIPVREVPSETSEFAVEPTSELSVEEDIFTDEEADRLMTAMARFKAVDPEFVEVVEGLVDFVCSGQPIAVMNGMVNIDYKQVKDIILKR